MIYSKLQKYDVLLEANVGVRLDSKRLYVGYSYEVTNYSDCIAYDVSDIVTTPIQAIRPTIHSNKYLFSRYSQQQVSVYIHPKSILPRDIVRNNYKIVRDPDKADIYIVPDLCDKTEIRNCYMLLKLVIDDKTTVVLVTLSYTNVTNFAFTHNGFTENDIAVCVANYIADGDPYQYEILSSVNLAQVYNPLNGTLKNVSAYTLPKIPAYYEIMQGNPSYKYAFDTDMPLTGLTELTAESLYIMRRNQDKSLVLRTLLRTNWESYPVTTALFLFSVFETGGQVRRLLPSGDYILKRTMMSNFPYWTAYTDKCLPSLVVYPEDVSLLQEWLFKEVGCDGDCGYINFDKFDSLPAPLKYALAKKIAVKRIKTTEPVVYQSMKQSC